MNIAIWITVHPTNAKTVRGVEKSINCKRFKRYKTNKRMSLVAIGVAGAVVGAGVKVAGAVKAGKQAEIKSSNQAKC